MSKLTSKQEAFAKEYVLNGGDASAAYRKSYNASRMKAETIHKRSGELLKNGVVAGRVEELQSEVAKVAEEKFKVDASYVLNRLIQIDQMDVLDILGDNGELKPISEWPQAWRLYISGFDITEQYVADAETDDRQITKAELKKIKWPDKIKNLELLGKHVEVNAYRENVNHSGEIKVPNWHIEGV